MAGESAQHPDAILSKERGRTRQIEASSTPANVLRIHPWSAAARTCSTQPSVCAAIRRNGRWSFTESRRRDVSRRSHRVDGIIYRAGVATISCCTWRARRRVDATRGGPSLAARRERGFAALRFVSRWQMLWTCRAGRRAATNSTTTMGGLSHKLRSVSTYEGAGGWRRESSNAKMTTGVRSRSIARAWPLAKPSSHPPLSSNMLIVGHHGTRG